VYLDLPNGMGIYYENENISYCCFFLSLFFLHLIVESTLREHQQSTIQLLTWVAKYRKEHELETKTFRIGFSGSPGAGKSTFIEALGIHLTDKGHRVAVLVRIRVAH
jgi:pantothenate kinase